LSQIVKMSTPHAALVEQALEYIHSSSATCVSDVLGAICSDAGADYGVLLSLVGSSHLEFDAFFGYPDADVIRFRGGRRVLRLDDGLSLCVSMLKECAGQTKPEPRVFPGNHPRQYKITDGVCETLIYPIPLRDRFLGTLALESRRNGVLSDLVSDPDKDRFTTYARLVTQALHERQSVIYRFNEFLETVPETGMEGFYDGVLEWLAQEFMIDTSSVHLAEWSGAAASEMLVCVAARIMGRREENPRRFQHRIGEGYTGWIAKHGIPLILSDFHVTSGLVLDYYEKQAGERPVRAHKLLRGDVDAAVRSYAGFPLVGGRRVAGVLQAFNARRESVFSEERLLEMIGRRLGRELNDRERELRRNFLFELPNIETRSPQTVIRGVVDVAMRVAAATHGWYMQREPNTGLFVAKAVRGEGLRKDDIPSVPAEGDEIVAFVSRTRREWVCPDLDHLDPGIAEVMKKSFRPVDAKSALIVPVYLKFPQESADRGTRDHEDLGVLVLFSYRRGAFVDDDIVVTALGELVSYHIWGLRKLTELQKVQAQVAELEASVSLYNQVVTATATAPSAVHTAKKHVNVVMPLVERLQKHKLVNEARDLRQLVRQIYRSVEELSAFHRQMHDIFAFKTRFEPCDLRALINDARGFLDSTFNERKIELKVGQFPEGRLVSADRLLMKVVFINLLQNSIEAGARKIMIKGEVSEISPNGWPRPTIKVTYSDDGVGIAEDDWPKVFEPFFTKNKEKGSGSGLGMKVAQDVMERHSGTIAVEQGALGEGVTFVLQCPFAPDPDAISPQGKRQ
jgi:signal transduction histidine kinase